MAEANSNEITFFARTNFRNREVPFGIKADDRRRHMYVIGKTGMGKTTLMENMAIQDIRNGHGVCFMDPHGDSVVKILDFIPSERVNDVIYFNPADLEYPIAFNIMESVEGRFKHLVASGLMGVFTKIWANLWSARMEYILGNTIRALLDSQGNTMLGITRMYIDKQYRKRIVDNIKDPMVRIFWTDEYANYDQKYVKEAIAPIQNKVGQFLSSAIIRNIVGQPKSTIDLRNVMDEKKILLMDLSKGKVGEENAALLGAMIITKLQLAAMSRVDLLEEERADFYLYVDEFQNFATESFATILSEARKYHLNLVMGHQYIGQLTPTKDNTRLRDAIFGNVGTMVTFRIGAADAEYLETEFAPTYTPNDLVNLPKYNILLKLMINGVSSEPFSARSIQVNPEFRTGNAEKVIRVSRERYGNPIAAVEERISRWMGAEFHQQSAVLAAGDDAEGVQGRFPEKAQDRKFIESAERAPIRPRNEDNSFVQDQKQPRPETIERVPIETSPEEQQVAVASNKQAEDSVVSEASAGGPLVFKMPEIPRPAPAPVFSRAGDSSRGDRSPARPARFSGPPQEQQRRRPEPSGHVRQSDNNRRGQAVRGQEQRGKSNSKTAPKPNIWDTVAEIHEEKVQHFGTQIAGVVGGAPKQDRGVQKKENSTAPAPVPATSAKILKPGEVHTF